jgi:hypothetical protein
MEDRYAAPRATVDDGIREPRSWRNAAIAFASGFVAQFALVAAVFAMDGDNIMETPRLRVGVAVLLAAALPAALLARALPRLKWYWVALLSPLAAVATLFLVAYVRMKLAPGW